MRNLVIVGLSLLAVGAAGCKGQETRQEVADAERVSLVVSGMT
jgi:hypothetical protein